MSPFLQAGQRVRLKCNEQCLYSSPSCRFLTYLKCRHWDVNHVTRDINHVTEILITWHQFTSWRTFQSPDAQQNKNQIKIMFQSFTLKITLWKVIPPSQKKKNWKGKSVKLSVIILTMEKMYFGLHPWSRLMYCECSCALHHSERLSANSLFTPRSSEKNN